MMRCKRASACLAALLALPVFCAFGAVPASGSVDRSSASTLELSRSYAQLAPARSYAQLEPSGPRAQLAPTRSYAQLEPSGPRAQLVPARSYAQLEPSGLHAQLEPAWPDLKLKLPLYLAFPPDDRGKAVVVEQDGRMQIFNANGTGADAKTYLDLRGRVRRQHTEEGLLGLAFHPRFAENRALFIYYSASNPRRTVLSRFTVRADNPDQVDPSSERVLLEVPQPFGNHNGGQLAFGPDGYLYLGPGDGGGAGDPYSNGQNPKVLLGKILRIDVDHPSGGRGYGIPTDNPFANGERGAPEVFAYGLRNPWRFSFDRATGALWVGDVGQDRVEEVDVVEKGGNYGWNILEGNLCYNASTCSRQGLILPVATYGRTEGISVTGGYVYRGKRIPALQGRYVFGDFGSGRIWSFPVNGARPATPQLLIDSRKAISSFGEDPAGELYVIDLNGSIWKIVGG